MAELMMVATSAETTMMVSNLETVTPKTKAALAMNDIIVTSHNTMTQMRKHHRSDVASVHPGGHSQYCSQYVAVLADRRRTCVQ